MTPLKNCRGNILEKHRNSTEISFSWQIPRFQSSEEVGCSLLSAPVTWNGTTWHLEIYPDSQVSLQSEGWLDLSLFTNSHPAKTVRVTVGIQRMDETEQLIIRDHKYSHKVPHTFHYIRRSKLWNCEPQLISLGALVINCIIRVEEVYQVGKNPFPSTDLGSFGEIRETSRHSDGISLEWKIPWIFALSTDVGDYYLSPEFEFLNTKWHLRVYPNGRSVEGWIELDVWKLDLSNCEKSVRLTLGMKNEVAEEEVIFRDQVLAANSRLWSGVKFMLRSQLFETDRKFLSSGALTVFCTLHADETSSADGVSREISSHSSSETFEPIREKFRSNKDVGFEWRVREFFSVSSKGDFHSSPGVEFLNTSWRFKIYPLGFAAEESHGWVGLDVWKMDWSIYQKSVRLTVGIKKADSTEEVIIRSQKLPMYRRLWRCARLVHGSELLRRKDHLFPSGVLTIVCSLSSKNPWIILRDCRPFNERDGIVRERECNSHKEVEWDTSLPLNGKMSPIFEIGSRSFWLKWEEGLSTDTVFLNLYSVGPPAGLSLSTLWWAGLKHPNGTYLFSNNSGILNPEEQDKKWVQRHLYAIKPRDMNLILPSRDVTVFLRLSSVERTPKSVEVCSHGAAAMSNMVGHGAVDYVACDYHLQTEWDIEFPVATLLTNVSAVFPKVTSPEFQYDTEKFKFEWSPHSTPTSKEFMLNLYSRSTSDAGSFASGRWWVGLKSHDGTYCLKNSRGELGAEDKCEIWTLRGSLTFNIVELWERELKVIFRYSRKEASTEAHLCIHGDVEMPVRAVGSIREEEFPSFKHVEWSVDFEPSNKKDVGRSLKKFECVASPEFVVGSQRFLLEFTQDWCDSKSVMLYLYRLGLAVTDAPRSVRWWAGFRRGDGAYSRKNRRGELDLATNCEVWTQTFLHRMSREEIEKEMLTPDLRLTLFVRLSEDRMSSDEKADNNAWDKIQLDAKRCRVEDSEVIFQVKGEEFKISTAVLENRVPVLNAMFQYDTVEKRTGVATIEDCEPAIFGEFLEYVFYGFLHQLNERNAFALYTVADKYLLEDLKAESLQAISQSISVNTFCDTLILAHTYGEENLLSHATDFFAKNYKNIIKSDKWAQICENNLEAYRYLAAFFFTANGKICDTLVDMYCKRRKI